MTPKFFTITDMEAGIQNTGKRSANYHCYLEIYDGAGILIPKHHLQDVFYGKWTRCEKVIKGWRNLMKKNKLEALDKDLLNQIK